MPPYYPLDGPSIQDKISLTTGTAVAVKVGGSALQSRKVITLQPLVNDIYVYFAQEGETPTASTVTNKGIIIYGGAVNTYEATDSQAVFIVAATATTDVVIVERA